MRRLLPLLNPSANKEAPGGGRLARTLQTPLAMSKKTSKQSSLRRPAVPSLLLAAAIGAGSTGCGADPCADFVDESADTDMSKEEAQTRGVVRCSIAPSNAAAVRANYCRHGQRIDSGARPLGSGSITIDVHVHVVFRAKGPGGGDVSDAQILQQVAALNTAFSGRRGGADTAFRFRLIGTDRTERPDWATACASGSAADHEMRAALRRGGKGALNLYVCEPPGNLLGYSTFPDQQATAPARDGIIVHHRAMPGGGAAAYAAGNTAVHEAGHWLGLYHTFQGGCGAINDGVTDTPAEKAATYGCPGPRMGCGGATPDPGNNYMDYLDDACMTAFTQGQREFMDTAWLAFRAGR